MAVDQLINQLIRDEGERFILYKDSRGISTLGVGHNLETTPITKTASRQILADDIARIESELHQEILWIDELDTVRKSILINMAFNMGVGKTGTGHGLLSFEQFLLLVHQNRWSEAAAEMLKSRWAIQVGNRAKRLATQLLTGVWQ